MPKAGQICVLLFSWIALTSNCLQVIHFLSRSLFPCDLTTTQNYVLFSNKSCNKIKITFFRSKFNRPMQLQNLCLGFSGVENSWSLKFNLYSLKIWGQVSECQGKEDVLANYRRCIKEQLSWDTGGLCRLCPWKSSSGSWNFGSFSRSSHTKQLQCFLVHLPFFQGSCFERYHGQRSHACTG